MHLYNLPDDLVTHIAPVDSIECKKLLTAVASGGQHQVDIFQFDAQLRDDLVHIAVQGWICVSDECIDRDTPG